VPGRLDVLESKDGHRVWTVEVNANPSVDPVLLASSILLASDRQLREYSAADGSLSWQQSFDAAVTAVAASGERIFVALANRSVRTFDRKTHAPAMEMRLEATATVLVLAERRLFACGDDGSLSAYRNDRPDSLLWRVQRVMPIGRPVVDDRHVYVAEGDATARAYDVGNGTERWRLRLASRPRAGVQIAAGWVYFPMLSGAIAVAPARTRNGQPSSVIPFGSAEAANDFRQRWSGVTADGRMLVRVTSPASHPAWTLTAATRKDGS
jgi:outer membrane protein assembly factor BamB